MLSCLRKHKGKLLLLGAAVAGSYVGGRWLLNKAAELQEKRHTSEVEGNRLQRHYENNRQTCLTAVMSLLPRLREAVQSQLNAESITAELRTKSSGKVTLWENLKIICFTRVVVGVYVCCAVSALLRVQLSVLGAGLSLQHRDQCSGGDSATVQRQYLTTVQYLLGEGLQQMVTQVRQATERVLVSYSLKHQLSAEGVVRLLTEIRSLSASHAPASAGRADEQSSFLVQYILPKEQLLETEGETGRLAAATRDIVESAEFSAVLEGSVDQGFSLLSRQLADIHHSAAQSDSTLPVARVIPLVADIFEVLFSSSLVQEVGSSPELHKLSQNIFEAFSQPS